MKKLLSCIISGMLLLPALAWPAAEQEAAAVDASAAAEESAASEETASAEGSAGSEERIVLTIGDRTTRSGSKYSEELGVWKYLEDLLGVDIQYLLMTPEEYDARLASGDLPDVVATQNNLSSILENGVALDVDP